MTRDYEGAGLGLSISKAYVELLGGKIWVESNREELVNGRLIKNGGSSFFFTIPWYPVTENKTASRSSVMDTNMEKQTRGLKILLAEDDEISNLLITISTKGIFRELIRVKTGTEAVEACRNNSDFDLILMDIKMPEMDGYEATRQIRKFNKEVIIIAQTAYGLSGDRAKAIQAGCNDYIPKPIEINNLLKIIKSLMEK